MERGFAALSLDDEEEEVVHVQRRMDLERVLEGFPWTFSSHLMLVHHLGEGKDMLKVSLIFANFWIQIHDVPPKYFFKVLANKWGILLRSSYIMMA
ncbi:hypothetical protein J1N35_002442 [Gossypium stocksii]|uniref:DUF4283 domain-containing protein n=1 Tax=Gossypium stocksii TaxID=47602 RepID=A0A9D3WL08_9ROSI|nr:hypothetical protein J1N35_002442 [Gossypium stocksii]